MFHFLHACTCNSYTDKKNKEKISQINYTVLRNNEFSSKNLVQTHLLGIDVSEIAVTTSRFWRKIKMIKIIQLVEKKQA